MAGALKVRVGGVWATVFPGSSGPQGPTGPGASTDETVNTVTTSGSAQTIPAPTVATLSVITLTANCTLTFPAAAPGRTFTVVLSQDSTGGRSVTWPAVTWLGTVGTVPTLSGTALSVSVFTFVSHDGSTWLGSFGGSSV